MIIQPGKDSLSTNEWKQLNICRQKHSDFPYYKHQLTKNGTNLNVVVKTEKHVEENVGENLCKNVSLYFLQIQKIWSFIKFNIDSFNIVGNVSWSWHYILLYNSKCIFEHIL